MTLPIIDTGPSRAGWHKRELILTCAQKFAWTYVGAGKLLQAMKLSDQAKAGMPPPAEPLLRGTLLHIFLAHLYEHLRRRQGGAYGPAAAVALAAPLGAARCPAAAFDSIATPTDAMEEMIGQYEDAWDGSTAGFRATLRQACLRYAEEFAALDYDRFEILGAEVLFEDTISDAAGHSALFTQRIDLIVRARVSGLIFYNDHKGTAHIAAKVRKRYTLSGQFLAMQHFGRLRHGRDFGGVHANLIGMKPIAFERSPVEPAPFRLGAFERDILYAARLEAVLRSTYGEDPAQWPGSPSELTCVTAYGPCQFHEMCRFGPDVGPDASAVVQLQTPVVAPVEVPSNEIIL